MYPKIIATLGPASQTYEQIKKLVQAGVDIFRLNFSHGTHDDHSKKVTIIRNIVKELHSDTKIMADIQGPKLRIGKFTNISETLIENQDFILDLDTTPGNNKRVNFPHKELYSYIKPGTNILINDGLVHLEVIECSNEFIKTKVINNGTISDNKGVNIVGIDLPIKSYTTKDIEDIKFAKTLMPDYWAASFIRNAQDIIKIKELIDIPESKIIAKIELPQAIENINDIINVSYGIMVARGDLGLETPLWKLPKTQEYLVRTAHYHNKMVIIATQMLQSMVNAPIPTRAEVTDVYTAYKQGASALMLSNETASGKFGVEAVKFIKQVGSEFI